eukprot:TRINITY_DN10073_c1_g1_i1.p1 TRINITY_DN10073_c1_g1~~TRINITY_DN10073_c1_g1_i1.p1  ORF type:complete len:193 (+),score=-13.92 TRINITY_DN10073_c1_g1_i1:490-1068(+)
MYLKKPKKKTSDVYKNPILNLLSNFCQFYFSKLKKKTFFNSQQAIYIYQTTTQQYQENYKLLEKKQYYQLITQKTQILTSIQQRQTAKIKKGLLRFTRSHLRKKNQKTKKKNIYVYPVLNSNLMRKLKLDAFISILRKIIFLYKIFIKNIYFFLSLQKALLIFINFLQRNQCCKNLCKFFQIELLGKRSTNS